MVYENTRESCLGDEEAKEILLLRNIRDIREE
jgi:hypothetical protein